MRGTQGAHHAVDGQFEALGLEPLLEFCFRVFGGSLHAGVDFDRLKESKHQRFCGLITGIQKHRTNQGLQGVGQNRGSLLSARFHLPLAQANERRQLQIQGQTKQGVLLDQIGPHT